MRTRASRSRKASHEPEAHRAQFLWTFFVAMVVAFTALYNAVQNPGGQSRVLLEESSASSELEPAATGQLSPLDKIRSTASNGK